MIGIKRLRKLAGDYKSLSTKQNYIGINTRRESDLLYDIADQIERERACDGDTAENILLIVGGVVDEMERHVLGHEGMDDSPVARWARELREALGGGEHDPSKDVSMSAYDLLPQEDRDAIAWVREHGGIGELRRMFQDADSRRVELCAALGIDLDKGWSEAMAAMRLRLMPEGMEWLVEAWPRFEDGAPLGRGDEVMTSDGAVKAEGLSLTICDRDGGVTSIDFGERVKHPAPKVLDADGVEIEVGDDLYSVEGGLKLHVGCIDTRNGKIATAEMYALDKWADPAMYTHRAPVLAADGKPLREGETVWKRTDGKRLTVMHLVTSVVGLIGCSDGTEAFGTPVIFNYCPSELTHERPDSWERLEEDATIDPRSYCSKHRLYIDPYDGDSAPATEKFARDLVRRARALAERGQ